MYEIEVYDKVSWHYPEGKDCPSLDAAMRHFKIIMEWLKKKNLLSQYGEEIYDAGIDSDFALTSDMLTDKGNLVLQKCYRKWLKTINYEKVPSVELLEECLKSLNQY